MITIDISLDRIIIDAGKFEEGKHPRAKGGPHGGEFTKGSGGGAGSTSLLPAKQHESGKRIASHGGELPEHIAKLRIPPAWTGVSYNPDPNGHLMVVGRDVKGRRQAIYSASHSASAAEAKYGRIAELDKRFDAIQQKNEQMRKSANPTINGAADAAALVMSTGIRPGSESDTGAEKQAYGATTLQGKHVVKTPDGVRLQFTGKKGVSLNIPVTDPGIAKMLLQRKVKAGDDQQLFPVDERMLIDHIRSIGGFRTKDFRTLMGTRTAMDEVAKTPAPTDEKSYKRQVMQVAKAVAQKLGNTPTIALQSYINPVVFAEWRMAASGGKQHA